MESQTQTMAERIAERVAQANANNSNSNAQVKVVASQSLKNSSKSGLLVA